VVIISEGTRSLRDPCAMVRWILNLVLLAVLAGCAEDRRPRRVSATPTPAGEDAGAPAVTRPPRAIATH
jgi:hypothetical protein